MERWRLWQSQVPGSPELHRNNNVENFAFFALLGDLCVQKDPDDKSTAWLLAIELVTHRLEMRQITGRHTRI
jgi:hypothetical protein